MAAASVQTCVTSPPYWGLRDYGVPGQLGLEPTPEDYTAAIVQVFREVRRVLKADGTLWLNLGDCYAAHPGQRKTTDAAGPKQLSNAGSPGAPSRHVATLKPKDLVGIPWRVAFALQADGWYLRSDIIWHKPNPMPESVRDRPTKSHEYLFLLSKRERYFYDAKAIEEPRSVNTHARGSGVNPKCVKPGGRIKQNSSFSAAVRFVLPTRNKRTVWKVGTAPFPGAHFATFPPKLIEPCILAGSRKGDTVLDPFAGAATTGLVAMEHGREFIGIELSPEYCELAAKRLQYKPIEGAA